MIDARTPRGPPMTRANMRANGVRAVIAACEACGHSADVNVDALAETIVVPEVGGACASANAAGTGSMSGRRGTRAATRGAGKEDRKRFQKLKGFRNHTFRTRAGGHLCGANAR